MYVFSSGDVAEYSELYRFDYSGIDPHWSLMKNLGVSPPAVLNGAMNLFHDKIVVYGGTVLEESRNVVHVYELPTSSWFKGRYVTQVENDTESEDSFPIAGRIPRIVSGHCGVCLVGKIRYFGGARIENDMSKTCQLKLEI